MSKRSQGPFAPEPESEEAVLPRALGRDSASLRWIRHHRAKLKDRALRGCPPSTVALARLFDVEGVDEGVFAALREIEGQAVTFERLPILVANGYFELGDLTSASEVLAQATQGAGLVAVEARITAIRLDLLLHKTDETSARASNKLETLRPLLDTFDRPTRALFYATDGALKLNRGHKLDALEAMECALAECLAFDGAVESAVAYGLLGNIQLDLGDRASATQSFRQSVSTATSIGNHSTAAVFRGYLGQTSWLSGAQDRARRQLGQAAKECAALGMERHRAHFAALHACVGLTDRNLETRASKLHQALAAVGRTSDETLHRALSPLRGLLALARAARARTHGDTQSATAHRVAAYRHVRDVARDSDDGRLVALIVEEAFEKALPTAEDDETKTLCVHPGGLAVRHGRETFSFAETPTLARLLWLLVEGAVDGRSVPDETLRQMGWPAEKSSERSRTHRLRVAISTLRKQVPIERAGDGYRLPGPVSVARCLPN